MTGGIAPIHNVLSRISSIESRFVSERPERLDVVEAEEFDAFGTVYQQALETRSTAPTASAPTGAEIARVALGSSSLAAPSGPVATSGGGHAHGHTHGQATITSDDPDVVAAINGAALPGARPVGG